MCQWQPVEGLRGEAFARYASTGLSMTAHFMMSFLVQNPWILQLSMTGE